MSKLLRIHMPTKVYLKKYITFYEGAMPRVNNKTPFGRYVFALLTKHTVIRDQHYAPTWLKRDENNDKLTLLVTQRTFTHVGDTVSLEKAAYINHFLKAQFDQALAMAVMNLHFRKGKTIKNALQEFAEAHGIEVEVDISLDNLLKKWHRTIQELEPKSHQNITSPLLTPYPMVSQPAIFPDIEPVTISHAPSVPQRKNVTGSAPAPDERQLGLFAE